MVARGGDLEVTRNSHLDAPRVMDRQVAPMRYQPSPLTRDGDLGEAQEVDEQSAVAGPAAPNGVPAPACPWQVDLLAVEAQGVGALVGSGYRRGDEPSSGSVRENDVRASSSVHA